MKLLGIWRVLGGLSVAAACAAPVSAVTITVNSATDTRADDGECTLREAIEAANRNSPSGNSKGECTGGSALAAGVPIDVIDFVIPGKGPFAISPQTPLPYVTEAVFIDGYSQTGAKRNTLRNGSDAVLMLELRGDKMSYDCDKTSPIAGGGFQFVGGAASGSRLSGFAMGGFSFPSGDKVGVVTIFRAGDVQIDGNFIGFDASGSLLDNMGTGVLVLNGAFQQISIEQSTPKDDGGPGNRVGGSSPQERNIISGNDVAVWLGGQRNRVDGNYIGVNVQGDASLPNRDNAVLAGTLGMVDCSDSRTAYQFTGSGNIIGGRGNFFSAEGNSCAVQLRTSGNEVLGNRMGTDRDGGAGPSGFGLAAQPGCGVLVERAAAFNAITYNTIAYNDKGVVVRTLSGVPVGNDIRANSIHSNAGEGIDLANDGVTANDADDADTGPNGLQNFPERLAATPAGVRGLVSGKPNTDLRIDFYRNQRCDTSGNGEGERYLGSTSVLTDMKGNASFNASVPGLTLEQLVTATATSATDGTSEFSECSRILSGIAAQVELLSSRNPVRSHDKFDLTVNVRGSGGVKPKGLVKLYDVAHSTTMANGQIAYHQLAYGTLDPSHPDPDTSSLVIPSKGLQLYGSQWGNVQIRAQFDGDATYAPAASMDLTQTIYREKSDLDGNGLTDLILCDPGNAKFLVQAGAGSFTGPFALPALGPSLTVLGTAELGYSAEPAVVWRDAAGAVGGTTFSGGSTNQAFSVPLPPGLTFEGLGSLYGDLKDDVVVRDAAGQHSGMLTVNIGSGALNIGKPYPIGLANGLPVEQVGDFNGDGNLDWLLRDPTSGAYSLWLLNGAFTVVSMNPLNNAPSGGNIAATGDFNGDGRTDLVWRLPTSDFEIALQNGSTTVGQTMLRLAPLRLSIVGTGFFDDGSGGSGGRSSLVMRNTMTGQLEAWINTGVNAGLPVFGSVKALPTSAAADLTVCVP